MFSDCNPEKGYTVTGCRYKNLLEQITKICRCFPAYMKDGWGSTPCRLHVTLSNFKCIYPNARVDLLPKQFDDCVFSMHASCVSFVMTKFGESEVYCKPV